MRIPIFILFIFTLMFIRCKNQTRESPSTQLQKELSGIFKNDQLYREEMAKVKPTEIKIVELVNKQDSLDAINLKRVIAVLDSMGYLARKEFGDSAGLATFFVVQHANIKYQEKYLPLFKQAALNNQIEWKNVVYMIDRVLLEQDRKQIYGTQVQPLKDSVTGYLTDKAAIAPIEDEEHVNERRAKVGLGTIEEEAKNFGIDYHLPK